MKTKSSAVVTAIIIIVALAIISGGIYWFVIKEPEISPPPEDQFKDWKTYRNEEYGFEVKYPSDWEYELIYNAVWFGPKNLNLSTKAAWVESDRFGICPQGCLGFGLEFLEPTSNELVIGGLKAERTDYKTGTGTTISIIKFLENKLPNSWSFIDQGFNLFFNSDERANKFDQILSTFKFLD